MEKEPFEVRVVWVREVGVKEDGVEVEGESAVLINTVGHSPRSARSTVPGETVGCEAQKARRQEKM